MRGDILYAILCTSWHFEVPIIRRSTRRRWNLLANNGLRRLSHSFCTILKLISRQACSMESINFDTGYKEKHQTISNAADIFGGFVIKIFGCVQYGCGDLFLTPSLGVNVRFFCVVPTLFSAPKKMKCICTKRRYSSSSRCSGSLTATRE